MSFGSRPTAIVILVVAFALLLFIEVIPFIPGGDGPPPLEPSPDMSPAERFPYFGTKFALLPAWAKVWMEFQDIIIGAALFFVLWRREAQIYLLCFIASHIFVLTSVALVPVELLTLEVAALSHWFWIPGLVILLRNWSQIDKQTGYGTWYSVAIAQLTFSLLFDIPDGLRWLWSLV